MLQYLNVSHLFCQPLAEEDGGGAAGFLGHTLALISIHLRARRFFVIGQTGGFESLDLRTCEAEHKICLSLLLALLWLLRSRADCEVIWKIMCTFVTMNECGGVQTFIRTSDDLLPRLDPA